MNFYKSILISFLFISSLYLSTQAATITVSPGESIQSAILSAQPGDVVELTAGVHQINEGEGEIEVPGKNNITIRGASKGVIIQNLDNDFSGDNGSTELLETFFVLGSSNITFERIIFAGLGKTDAQRGIEVANSQGITVKNCLFIGLGTSIIINERKFADPGTVMNITNNIFAFNATFGGGGDALELDPRGGGFASVTNNVFYANSVEAIEMGFASDDPIEVKNNIIIASKPFRQLDKEEGSAISITDNSNVTIQKNIFFKNKRNDLFFQPVDGTGILFKKIGAAEAELNGLGSIIIENNLRKNPKLRGARPSIAAFKSSWGRISKKPKALSNFIKRMRFGVTKRSPAKNAGTDGTDIGISGGECPFTDFL